MLDAEHGDTHVRVGERRHFRADALDLVAEDHAEREARGPIEQIDSVDGGFDGGDFVSAGAQVLEHRHRLPGVFPGHHLVGAQGGLGDGVLGRAAGDSAETELLDRGGIGRPKEGADVVQAADVVQEDGDGKLEILVQGAGGGGLKGKAIHNAKLISFTAMLSIVIPIHNEEHSILPLYDRLTAVLEKLQRPYEILFVDDASNDRSFELLANLVETDGHLKVIRLRRNFGQTAALSAGFHEAKGEVVIAMDGDLQHAPEDIPALLAEDRRRATTSRAVGANIASTMPFCARFPRAPPTG